MSFCNEQKKEIAEQEYKSLCCRRALLSGVLAAKGILTENGAVEIRVTSDVQRMLISALVKEIYSKQPEISASKSGGRGKKLTFKSNSASKFILEIEKDGGLMYTPRCGFCRSAFLRGMFLISGRVTEPRKQYLLEFSTPRHERFLDFLTQLGLDFKLAFRKANPVIYTKNSTCIEDFFGLASMNFTSFSIMNSKIKGELRNNANRVANCETSNIDKAVGTAMRQISLISKLEEAGLLQFLPEELVFTARVRLEYPSLSLSQLASKFTPPISKPGLSHRLAKIEELGEKLLNNLK